MKGIVEVVIVKIEKRIERSWKVVREMIEKGKEMRME